MLLQWLHTAGGMFAFHFTPPAVALCVRRSEPHILSLSVGKQSTYLLLYYHYSNDMERRSSCRLCTWLIFLVVKTAPFHTLLIFSLRPQPFFLYITSSIIMSKTLRLRASGRWVGGYFYLTPGFSMEGSLNVIGA